jgi:hypothetical protein
MRRILLAGMLIAATGSTACNTTAQEARNRAREFQRLADDGKIAEIRQSYAPTQSQWEQYMAGRAKLGRLVRTTEANRQQIDRYDLIVLQYNSEFEHGRAIESFSFRDGGTRLASYDFAPGKTITCRMITGCDTSDAP